MSADQATVLVPGAAATIDLGSATIRIHADSATTGGAFSLIETEEGTIGTGPPLHIHHDCAESFFVLAGSYAMFIDGERHRCSEGSFVHVPRGIVHTFQALEIGSRKLNLYSPSGMVAYFEELAEALLGQVDEAELERIATRAQMEIVGPIPEGYL